jgi:hypothetical protein
MYLDTVDEVDDELIAWIRQAYESAAKKATNF